MTDLELLETIKKEIKKYTNHWEETKILYRYNKMTIEEIAQEVFIKILRSVGKELTKSYIRQAVIFVCIDLYRKRVEVEESRMVYSRDSKYIEDLYDDLDLKDSILKIEAEDVYRQAERELQLKQFTPKELKVIQKLMEGCRNPEIRESLGIPKMTYYTLLKKIKELYT